MVDYRRRYTAMSTVSYRFLLLCDKKFFFAYGIYVCFIRNRMTNGGEDGHRTGTRGDNIASRRTIGREPARRRYVIDRDHLSDLITLIDTTVST